MRPHDPATGRLTYYEAALEKVFSAKFVYVCVDNPERSIQRVRERVAQRGHDVPDHDIRRRYVRGLANAKRILHIVHQALVFDNSDPELNPMYKVRNGPHSYEGG